jgi:hypothetical protein
MAPAGLPLKQTVYVEFEAFSGRKLRLASTFLPWAYLVDTETDELLAFFDVGSAMRLEAGLQRFREANGF